MAAAVVNRVCHTCTLNLCTRITVLPARDFRYPKSLWYSGGIRRRNVAQLVGLLNHRYRKDSPWIFNGNHTLKKLSTNEPNLEKARNEETEKVQKEGWLSGIGSYLSKFVRQKEKLDEKVKESVNEGGEVRPLINIEDLKNHLQDQLSKRESITPKRREDYMNIVDALAKQRLRGIPVNQLEVPTSEEVSASELYILGEILLSLKLVAVAVGDESVSLAIPVFKLAASLGYKDARYKYGQFLIAGTLGMDLDPFEAAKIFTDLAREGHPLAQHDLAVMYASGFGVAQSFARCLTFYEESAANGNAVAYTSIGRLYLHGQGVDKDGNKAIEYFVRGADAGDVHACMYLVDSYSDGKGVGIDLEKAFHYNLKAADAGHTAAMHNIGCSYSHGVGCTEDFAKAAEYFQKAGDGGFMLSSVNLAMLYASGVGVELDLEKAKELCRKVAPHLKVAQEMLDKLTEQETLEEEKKLQQLESRQ